MLTKLHRQMRIRFQEDFLNADPCGSGSATLIELRGKIASAARNRINSAPKTDETTFAFASLSILLW